jgi:hypothetical protein
MKARWLVAMEKRPWALAAAASVGTTLLVSGGFALLAPPDMLDAAVALGDGRLALALAGLFAISTPTFRVAFARRRSAEEDLDAEVSRRTPADLNGTAAPHHGNVAPGLRTYLR